MGFDIAVGSAQRYTHIRTSLCSVPFIYSLFMSLTFLILHFFSTLCIPVFHFLFMLSSPLFKIWCSNGLRRSSRCFFGNHGRLVSTTHCCQNHTFTLILIPTPTLNLSWTPSLSFSTFLNLPLLVMVKRLNRSPPFLEHPQPAYYLSQYQLSVSYNLLPLNSTVAPERCLDVLSVFQLIPVANRRSGWQCKRENNTSEGTKQQVISARLKLC